MIQWPIVQSETLITDLCLCFDKSSLKKHYFSSALMLIHDIWSPILRLLCLRMGGTKEFYIFHWKTQPDLIAYIII